MTPTEWLDKIERLDTDVRRAELDLEASLRAFAETPEWLEVSYADLAGALGVTRQAARQRIARLLDYNRAGVRPGPTFD